MIGRRKRCDEDFAQEISAHLELEADRLREEGLSEAEARAAAHRAFGNVTSVQERFYESGRLIWLEQLVQDLRHAARLLRKSPGSTIITILTLAIGIGANTAMFSVVDACLLRPIPYPDSDRLITVWTRPPQGGHLGVAAGNFLDIQKQSRSFEHMGVLAQADFHLSTSEGAERLSGFRVSAEFLDALGVRPAIGRGFALGEDRPGAAPLAILSHAAWRSKFGGDPRILGQAITLDGRKCTVIGVMPESFRFAFSPELWTQLVLDPAAAARDIPNLLIFAKLKRGVGLKQAKAEMQGILGNLARAYPQAGLNGWSIDLVPWQQEMARYHRDTVVLLFGAVSFVLLIACVNVANLLLAKSAVRHRELAVRAAVGAGRQRLIRQLLTESALMAGLGGVAGVLLAVGLTPLAATLIAEPLRAGLAPMGIDGRVLTFTLALSLLAGLLFGLVPAWRASRIDLYNILKDTGRCLLGGSGGRTLRSALVVLEVALALILLVGAGLLTRTLVAYSSVDPGFRVENVLTMRVVMPEARYTEGGRLRAFVRQLLAKARAVPGVRAACLASFMPLDGSAYSIRFQVGGAEKKTEPLQIVTDGYFETLGIHLRQGRFFNERDNEAAPRVVIVNETFVSRHLASEEALGQRLIMEQWRIGGGTPGPLVPWEIVGVVGDVKLGGLGSAPMPTIYAPVWQQPRIGGVLGVRTESDPSAEAPALRAVVRAVDQDVPVTDVRTMQQAAALSVVQPRMRAWMAAAFATMALILAALGIYGVISYSVAQSTQEMGIRMALGARPRQVLYRTLRGGLMMAGLGLAIGLVGSLALTRLFGNLLYAVKPADPATYIVVSALLTAVAVLAAYLPARRAARVDPSVALRWE
ncbi:MAG: ADOP family duplicated permease [Bryobacteraceae bacterium]